MIREKIRQWRYKKRYDAGYYCIYLVELQDWLWIHKDLLNKWGYKDSKDLLDSINSFETMAALLDHKLTYYWSDQKRGDGVYMISSNHPGDILQIEVKISYNKKRIIKELRCGMDLWMQIDSNVPEMYNNSVYRQIDTAANLL
jgi:hypothetical protein